VTQLIGPTNIKDGMLHSMVSQLQSGKQEPLKILKIKMLKQRKQLKKPPQLKKQQIQRLKKKQLRRQQLKRQQKKQLKRQKLNLEAKVTGSYHRVVTKSIASK